MHNSIQRAGLALLVGACLGGAGPEGWAASYSRRSPIVEAVQKTRDAIVTIKVDKRTGSGRKEVVGTGVVVDERGYLVTNRHVIAAAERVRVGFADGSVLAARVYVEDENHDLAILKVSTPTPLKALSFGPGSDLMVGETVIVVGNPFGYSNTVSTGIISALGREVPMPGGVQLTNLIQTNASINPGNSGGPLLNVNGELIGIAVALREGAQGIAFALNADTVQQVLSYHLSARNVARIGHGLGLREAVAAAGEVRQRVVVADVAEDGPAAQAGVQGGDVLCQVAGRAVSNRFDVERALWSCQPGENVTATILRDGKETQVQLKLVRSGEASRPLVRREASRDRSSDRFAKPAQGNH
jgi:serine protease Do